MYPAILFFFFNDTATTEIYTLSLHDALPIYFGREIHFAESAIGRAMNVGGVTYSEYRLVLLLLAVVLGVAVWLVMQRTQIGIVARAVIMNEELAQALGINTRLVRFVTFGLGAGLAALAGALLTPLISVHPNLGVPWLINAFMLVLVAGGSAPEPGACPARSRRRAGAPQLVL